MRVAVVVAAMLFCMAGCSRKEPRKSVTNSIGMELIEIPAGTFTMGSPGGDGQNNETQVAVTLTKPFRLGKTEVTQGQWKSVMGTEPWISPYGYRSNGYLKNDKDWPATWVSWEDAKKFCEKLTVIERESGKLKADEEYRLPTDAEWEYACRAGTTTAYSFGDDVSKLGAYAWFDGNHMAKETPNKVGKKKPNPWGLHDMHGNVSELCWDGYGDVVPGGSDVVQSIDDDERVCRGGSYRDRDDRNRSACRGARVAGAPDPDLGFRVARSQSVQWQKEKVRQRRPLQFIDDSIFLKGRR